MRILNVIADTDPKLGGTVEAVRTLSQMLPKLGHTVEVLSLEPAEIAAQREFDAPVTGVGHGIGSHRINPKLVRWLNLHAGGFDVVVLHGLWNWTSVGAWLALRKSKTPYYVFAHGAMAPWFRERYPIKHIGKQIYWWIAEGRVLRDAQAVLFTSEEERLESRGAFHGFDYRECVVPFGTVGPKNDPARDREEFYQAYPALRGRPFLLFISRIHPKKGCDLLVNAFAECIHEVPPGLAIVIAGPDQTGLGAELRAQARTFGIAERIYWPGMLTGGLKWGALRLADAMILPSHQENFGFVVPEAMASSTPVLISNKVNIWREVKTAGAGLVEPDTQEGTARLIRRFYRLSPEERDRMALSALEAFQKNFDIEVTVIDFARAIGALMDGPKKPLRPPNS